MSLLKFCLEQKLVFFLIPSSKLKICLLSILCLQVRLFLHVGRCISNKDNTSVDSSVYFKQIINFIIMLKWNGVQGTTDRSHVGQHKSQPLHRILSQNLALSKQAERKIKTYSHCFR